VVGGVSRGWLLVLAAGLLAGCPYRGPNQSLQFEPVPVAGEPAAAAALAQTAEILRSRLAGVPGSEVTAGAGRLTVSFPAKTDPHWIEGVCTKPGRVEFILLPANLEWVTEGTFRDRVSGKEVTTAQAVELGEVVFDQSDLAPRATAVRGVRGGVWDVRFEFESTRKRAFRDFTKTHILRHLAFVLDGEPVWVPEIRSAIPGVGVIDGGFTGPEASDLARVLNSGPLPVPLRVVEAGRPDRP